MNKLNDFIKYFSACTVDPDHIPHINTVQIYTNFMVLFCILKYRTHFKMAIFHLICFHIIAIVFFISLLFKNISQNTENSKIMNLAPFYTFLTRLREVWCDFQVWLKSIKMGKPLYLTIPVLIRLPQSFLSPSRLPSKWCSS